MAEEEELSFEAITFGERTKQPNQLITDKENEDADLDDHIEQKNVLLVYTSYGGKLNPTAIVSCAEELGGKLKTHNFREKQCFGFLQFEEDQDVEKALDNLNNKEIDGTVINVERCPAITAGRDPRTHDYNSEYKNSTLVFKNLPFQLKQEKLEEMLNALPNKPMNVSYLYDANGMFRGMAFVKYKDIEHGKKAFEAMNNLDINGRKLRIEYKRKVREAEATQEDDVKHLYDQMVTFSTSALNELAFPCASSYQRKQIHQFAERLGLGHYSTGEGESRFVLVKKKEADTPTHAGTSVGGTPTGSYSSASSLVGSPSKGQPIGTKQQQQQGRRRGTNEHPRNSWNDGKMSPSEDNKFLAVGSFEKEKGVKISRSFGSSFSHIKSPPEKTPHSFGGLPFNNAANQGMTMMGSSPSSSGSFLGTSPVYLGTSPTYRKSAAILNRNTVDGPLVQLARQPRGPDGTNGFSQEYRKQRNTSAVRSP